MSGLLYVIEKLGQSLAQAEADVAALQQENAALRAEAEEASSPPCTS